MLFTTMLATPRYQRRLGRGGPCVGLNKGQQLLLSFRHADAALPAASHQAAPSMVRRTPVIHGLQDCVRLVHCDIRTLRFQTELASLHLDLDMCHDAC